MNGNRDLLCGKTKSRGDWNAEENQAGRKPNQAMTARAGAELWGELLEMKTCTGMKTPADKKACDNPRPDQRRRVPAPREVKARVKTEDRWGTQHASALHCRITQRGWTENSTRARGWKTQRGDFSGNNPSSTKFSLGGDPESWRKLFEISVSLLAGRLRRQGRSLPGRLHLKLGKLEKKIVRWQSKIHSTDARDQGSKTKSKEWRPTQKNQKSQLGNEAVRPQI
jgi:hypothetical protein